MDRLLVFEPVCLLLLLRLSCIYLHVCKGCSTLDVRLVDSTSEGKGKLEICRLGNWVKVCKLGLTQQQMKEQVRVACRSLNFTSGFGTTIFSLSNLNVMATSPKITCRGSEVHFDQCTYKMLNLWRDPAVCGNEIVEVHCGYDYLFFSDYKIFRPSKTLPSMELISLDNAIPFRNGTLNIIHVSSTNGIMTIGSSPTTKNCSLSMEFDTVYHLTVFQTEVNQACAFSAVQTHVYSSLNTSNADFLNYVSGYISNRRGNSFIGMWAMYAEWRDMCVSPTSSQTLTYQVTFITDYQESYAVLTYQCPGSIPFYSPAIIGWGLAPNMTEFRYSQTNYSSIIACNEEGYYSLLIDIESQTNEEQQKKTFSSNGSCVDAGFNKSSCCQDTVDWTLSCYTESGHGYCYCDGLCFEREDCCQDIHKLHIVEACIPTCIEGSVALDNEGRVLYCRNGISSFISASEGWNNVSASLVCHQLGYGSGLAGQLSVPANDKWYTVHELSCEGNEGCLQDCTLTKVVNLAEEMSVASITCSGTLEALPFLCPKSILLEAMTVTMVTLPSPVLLGSNDIKDTVCIHVNGSLIFGETICVSHVPQLFPADNMIVVAPYWDDISILSPNASLRYAVIDDTSNPLMEQVTYFVSNKEEKIFDPLWILVAQWVNVCPGADRFCTADESNTFQAVVTTDGFESYAIFSYRCGLLNWESTNGAVIGYSINSQYYENYMHSVSSNATNIACQQSPHSVWNSVIYSIGALQNIPILDLTEGDYHSLTDADSAAVGLPSSVLLGNGLRMEQAFIGTCGVITFGDEYIKPDTNNIPVTDPFVALVAPFWDDIDLSAGKGEIRHALVSDKEDRIFLHLESFLRKATDATFTLSWFLVSQWLEVCPSWDNICNQTMPNTFQGIIAVNDTSTIAVFTYECGKLNWISDQTVIGYSTDTDKYEMVAHDEVNQISCSNLPVVWANLIYIIGSVGPSPTIQTEEPSSQVTLIVVATIVPTILLIIIIFSIAIVAIAIHVAKKKSPNHSSSPAHCSNGEGVILPDTSRGLENESRMCDQRYVCTSARPDRPMERRQTPLFSIDSSLIDQIPQYAIASFDQLRLLDCVGKGEFGIVYKAHLFKDQDSEFPIDVAAKTTKGKINQEEVAELMRESIKMLEFSHPNVMGLLCVCVDAGPTPYVILPFMSGGSLYNYLKNNRGTLVLAKEEEMDEEDVVKLQSKLLSMCLQIAKGMEYLASKQFVHRDLAARNCMIDKDGNIKVADFGLSKSIYGKLYFREKGSDVTTKLPIKWMAIESIEDGLFTEKSDVWSFGVTCWEVFTGGKQPYGGINPLSLPRILSQGERMEIPANAACSSAIYELTMARCWKSDCNKRPTFSELVNDISSFLTQSANYIDFNSFRLTTETTSNTN